MKKLFTLLIIVITFTTTANALSYREARDRAWYITDKMAYELNLTEEQYDRAYEINLDYFLSVNSPHDYEGLYWRYRNIDFNHILFDWQYNIFVTTTHFYKPIIKIHGAWILASYNYYNRDFYYFRRPVIYNVYRGCNWRHHRRINRYHNYNICRGSGMRDRYFEKRQHHNYNAYKGYKSNKYDAKRYNYEWRNPGKTNNRKYTSNGNSYRENLSNRHENQQRPTINSHDYKSIKRDNVYNRKHVLSDIKKDRDDKKRYRTVRTKSNEISRPAYQHPIPNNYSERNKSRRNNQERSNMDNNRTHTRSYKSVQL